MKHLKRITAYIALLLCSLAVQAQVPDKIYSALRTGNATELAQHFNNNVELVILDKEGIFSKNQAEFIIKDFFAKNKPVVYTKLHEGGKDASHFVIGQLTTTTGKFRISFFMKNINGTFAIHQFRIENENN
jgi:hypothetical protein